MPTVRIDGYRVRRQNHAVESVRHRDCAPEDGEVVIDSEVLLPDPLPQTVEELNAQAAEEDTVLRCYICPRRVDVLVFLLP